MLGFVAETRWFGAIGMTGNTLRRGAGYISFGFGDVFQWVLVGNLNPKPTSGFWGRSRH